jgi:hypothetical protein
MEASPSGSRSSTKLVLTTLLAAGLLFLVGGAIVLQLFVARRIPELTAATFESATQRWDQNGPASYRMHIKIEGNQPGTVEIEVRDGEVTAMTRDGRAPPQRRTWDAWTVPGQFEMIEREVEMAADPEGEMHASRGTRLWLRCEFDQHLGYPRRFHRAALGGGTEVYWEVTSFTTLPDPSSHEGTPYDDEPTS